MGFKQRDVKYGPLMAVSASPGSLAEIQILRPTASTSLPMRLWNLCIKHTFYLVPMNIEE